MEDLNDIIDKSELTEIQSFKPKPRKQDLLLNSLRTISQKKLLRNPSDLFSNHNTMMLEIRNKSRAKVILLLHLGTKCVQ